MSTTALEVFPAIDATQQECITEAQAQFFRDNGLLLIRNVLRGAELQAMRDQTLPLVQKASASRVSDEDYLYRAHEITGKETPFRVEYVIDKTQAAKSLLGHPFILRSVEKLQGRNFIPTWDSMVFKNEGAGVAIPWHRDDGDKCNIPGKPIFNVDFYLDGSDMSNCLWGILGSNRWTQSKAEQVVAELNTNGFQMPETAVPIPMQPGDVIFHDVLALHGSPPAQTKLRRVVYFEFRAIEAELEKGPHTPQYIPLKQKVLLAALRERANSPFGKSEKAFVYCPDAQYAPPPLGADEKLSTWRYPHMSYWRNS